MRRILGVLFKQKITFVLFTLLLVIVSFRFINVTNFTATQFEDSQQEQQHRHNHHHHHNNHREDAKKASQNKLLNEIQKQKSTDRPAAAGNLNPEQIMQMIKNNQNLLNGNNNNFNQLINNNNNREPVKAGSSYDDLLKNMERIVHLDLKGAPPKPEYFKQFIPFIKEHGATGILLEYEDTFPFTGRLEEARHGRAYTPDDVELIKKLAKENNLTIMPLVQTYGHLEWLLKIKSFAHLREDSRFPQVISPCLTETYTVIYDMLDQVIAQHQDVPYFHVGCDEVYYKLSHPNCTNHPHRNDFTRAFMSHLIQIAKHVRAKLPKTKIIFWDDMLHGMDEGTLMSFKSQIEELEIEPMLWGYMEDVRSYFGHDLYVKYGHVFEQIWIATAYKGATTETTVMTSIEHHYRNHISWLDVMQEKVSNKILKFKGVAITGWSRYDHFLALCDLLPQAIPSLIFNLYVMRDGPLSDSRKAEITRKLGCQGQIPWFGGSDSYGSIKCTFPGHEVYEAVLPYESVLKSMRGTMEFADKYMTPINLQYGYLHKMRSLEVMNKLNFEYMSMTTFKNNFIKAANMMYWDDTAIEWLTVYFVPQLDRVYNMMTRIKELNSQNDWKPRPLPITLRPYSGIE